VIQASAVIGSIAIVLILCCICAFIIDIRI